MLKNFERRVTLTPDMEKRPWKTRILKNQPNEQPGLDFILKIFPFIINILLIFLSNKNIFCQMGLFVLKVGL